MRLSGGCGLDFISNTSGLHFKQEDKKEKVCFEAGASECC